MSNSQAIAAIMSAIALGATGAAILRGEQSVNVDECRRLIAIADAPPLIAAADAPELVDAVPSRPGKLIECTEAVANVDPGTPMARVATARCTWDVDGQPVHVWLQPEHAAKVRNVKEGKAAAVGAAKLEAADGAEAVQVKAP